MIITRFIRAIPYIAVAFAFGCIVGIVFDVDEATAQLGFPTSFIWWGVACALMVAGLIGRDIWRERHTWNKLERRFRNSGIDIRDHY